MWTRCAPAPVQQPVGSQPGKRHYSAPKDSGPDGYLLCWDDRFFAMHDNSQETLNCHYGMW
jgi:hypothetical protein